MQNTHGRTQVLGRAALVALLVAPFVSASAQIRRDDRDRIDPTSPAEILRDMERRDADIRRDDERERRRDAERRLFTWRGSVDDETRIYIRAANIQSRVISGSDTRRSPRVDRDRPLPRRDGYLRLRLIDGRGRVHVLQQPSWENNYTAIVRVKDAQRGADNYRFVAYFDPEDDWDRDDRHDRDGDWYGREARSGDRVLRWAGSVDRDLRITVRGETVTHGVASGGQPRGVRSDVMHALPRRDGYLEVALRQGRGTVQVIQQPTRYNNWTAVVRVLDSEGSYGYYDFELIWR